MTNSNRQISGDEAQIYDRQIRLWGLEAQNRLRNSSVLLIGLSSLGSEVAKNLTLSGLKSLVLMDDTEVSDAGKNWQFLIPPGTTGNRAQASFERVKVLNPMVEVSVDTGSAEDKPEEFFRQFDLVIVIDKGYQMTDKINKICRKNKIRFQAGGIFGWVGFAFFDFNNHIFLLPKPKEIAENVLDDDDEIESAGSSSAKRAKLTAAQAITTLTLEEEEELKVKKNIPFPSFEHTFDVKQGQKKLLRRRFSLPASYYVVRAFLRLIREKGTIGLTKEAAIEQWKKELDEACVDATKQRVKPEDFSLFIKSPLNPVCAIVGSVLSQEAIKALSQNDAPLKNVFLYSAVDSVGSICEISV